MQKNIFKSVLSSSIGNCLEWYEYTLYAYFSTVISDLFFPNESKYIGMMLTFATFAVGLLARPLGGILFGYIGDRYGRGKMLIVTIFLMSASTMCIGMLPTYATIGIFAPIILVLLRIIQGVALGGEFGTSCVYLFESVSEKQRGFFGSLALTGVGCGLVLSACTILILEALVSKETIYEYAWRIPFFISVAGGFIAYKMRKVLLETADFTKAKIDNNLIKNPFFAMLKQHKLLILKLFAIFLTTQISFFVVFIFGKTMMINFLHYENKIAGFFNLFTVISYTLATIFFGYLSDKINKKYIILFGTVGIFLIAIPFVNSLQGGSSALIFIYSCVLGVLIGGAEGTLNPLVSESFPTKIRVTSVAFCWNFTAILFGGTAPIISMWLIKNMGGVKMVAYYLMLACFITASVILFDVIREKLQRIKGRRFARINFI
jgi:MHS family proline/betaine transporter-like MFS transporter